jgi:hypothetical protein
VSGAIASWAAAVLQINCLTAAADALQPFAVAAPKCAQLSARVEELAEATVRSEAAAVLTACGLADKLALVTMYAEGTDHSNQVRAPFLPPPTSNVLPVAPAGAKAKVTLALDAVLSGTRFHSVSIQRRFVGDQS